MSSLPQHSTQMLFQLFLIIHFALDFQINHLMSEVFVAE